MVSAYPDSRAVITEKEIQLTSPEPSAMGGMTTRANIRPSSSRRSPLSPAAATASRCRPAHPGCILRLIALDIGPGDEVVVPDVTWIATSAPISYVGATAGVADVDPTSWCITAAGIEAVLTPRTNAVIVSIFTATADLDPILALCASAVSL